MDEAVGDGVADPVNHTRVHDKENELSRRPSSSSMLQSTDMIMPDADDYRNNSKHQKSGTSDAKNQDRIVSSEHASASPRCLDNAGVMVEELTLRNYDGEKMTVVGASNNRELMSTRQNHWKNLYQQAGRSGFSNPDEQAGQEGKEQADSGERVDDTNAYFTELLNELQSTQNYGNNSSGENVLSNEDKGASGEIPHPSGSIRTKIISKSGFSEFFVKSSLRDKGVLHRSQSGRGSVTESDLKNSAAPSNFTAKKPLTDGVANPLDTTSSRSICDGVNLREWLEADGTKVDKVEKMRIFRQVLNLVDISHSHGVPLQDLRPSCFKVSGSHQVMHLGSSVHEGTKIKCRDQDIHRNGKRLMHHDDIPLDSHAVKKHKSGENTKFIQRWNQFPSRPANRTASLNIGGVERARVWDLNSNLDEDNNPRAEVKTHRKLLDNAAPNSEQALRGSTSFMLEEKWYMGPETFNEKGCTFASNIYCLGVLLFELLAPLVSGRSHVAAMNDLRHRILPPRFILENPKEAGFCLWLLHPEPSLRPSTSEILQSEFMNESEELNGNEILSSIDEEEEESELLSHFLLSLNEQKQKDTSSLVEQFQCIEADIQEIEKRRLKKSGGPSSSGGNASLDASSKIASANGTEMMRNIKQLEDAYFSMRPNIQLSDSNVATRRDRELFRSHENWCTVANEDNTTDHLGGFYDGLCKYARYNKFKVRGVIRNGEFNSIANVICSLSFDRDEEYLAAGGVSKKIKIFEWRGLYDDSVGIHYPAVEMSNRSKLSCVCWNSYIRNYLASTDYDGIVKLWDASTGEGFLQFAEHSQRAWSVDFSRVDPRKLASGSDDRLVKIWGINDRNSLCTIRNSANICCVQFSPHSTHLLSFSSADYRTYCFDLRNASTPWCVLAGHERAVSYAKFLDADTIVSASTDNTLKVWDLKRTSPHSFSRDACVLTLSGHTNEKNFVGLSVADGYIACGSETNEVVYAYHRSLPMPITSHKFGSFDPITGKETENDNGLFVSSVCWRKKSNMVVAANSSGSIKLLQLV
ncbi:Protein SPA1-RELATED 2 [Striga hermonthica]|uniref:Protein SPA1-RELATED 2 n=1 Tax=Striga hermonthica TaxID=68872 RepID=A0A9N7RNT6_STRHE|nr:Protein SPA1-RELATED 2 [Striga hermonthica]